MSIRQQGDRLQIVIPAAIRDLNVSLSELLPLLQDLTDSVVRVAEEREASQRRRISCSAGCGACCRQLVPVSVTEAQALNGLLAQQPPEVQTRIRSRLREIKDNLRAAGLDTAVRSINEMPEGERLKVSLAYLAMRQPCPFLVAESCSIHSQRPLICRQFLVTSPAVHCQAPSEETITRVALAANLYGALRKLEREFYGPQIAVLSLLDEQADQKKTPCHPVRVWIARLMAGMVPDTAGSDLHND